jgi:uncharacterized protein YndB with AHSA1/START domain
MPEVTRRIEIQAPPSRVWRWFASPDGLRRWLSPDIDIDLHVGGSYRMPGGDQTTWITGTVLDLVTEGRLVLSWLEEGSGWIHPGRLVLELAATPGGTQVTLIHDGFAGIGKPGWEGTYEAYERGADRHGILEKLAAVVTSD